MNKKGQSPAIFSSKNRRGQGMSISTIILLILGVVVLVVLVLGFSVGWNKILPFVSQDNVNAITQQCNIACTTNDAFNFCNQTRDLTASGKTINETCYGFSTNASYTQFGIASCPSLSCPQPVA